MVITHMENHPTLKLIQILAPVQRCDILLCCREDKVYDDMEAGMDGVQGYFEEDGMKYGGGSHDEF